MIMHPRYVRIARFSELTGYSPRAVENLMASGTWLKDREYVKVGRCVLVDLEAYEAWVQREANAA